MKVIITIMAVSLLTACKEEEKEFTSALVAEIPGYVVVPNTEVPDYARYRKLWKKANTRPENGYKPVEKEEEVLEEKTPPKKKSKHDDLFKAYGQDPVQIELDELSFKHAFSLQHRVKGEGRTFWWRGQQYTTNLKGGSNG